MPWGKLIFQSLGDYGEQGSLDAILSATSFGPALSASCGLFPPSSPSYPVRHPRRACSRCPGQLERRLRSHRLNHPDWPVSLDSPDTAHALRGHAQCTQGRRLGNSGQGLRRGRSQSRSATSPERERTSHDTQQTRSLQQEPSPCILPQNSKAEWSA